MPLPFIMVLPCFSSIMICYEFDAHDISLITLVVSVFALFYPWFNE